MKRFLLLPTAFLLPCACISVNTAAQTLNAGTVYRNWELDDRAYVKNSFVYIKAVQCDQRKETPVIGPPMAQSDFISQMEDIPGTEKTVFLQLNKKDLPDPIEYKDLLSMVLEENFTVPPRFSLYGAHQITLPYLNLSRKENASPTVAAVKIISAPSTGRRILAGAQSCVIDAPGTVIANILLIPVGIVVTPCLGMYNLCSGE